MLGATHLIAGAAVYKGIPQARPLGLILAFGSHFALDAIPHHELNMMWNVILGAAAAAVLALAAWRARDIWLFVAGVLGVAPDVNWIFALSSTLNEFHSRVHFHSTTLSIPMMVLIEAIVFLSCLAYVTASPGRTKARR